MEWNNQNSSSVYSVLQMRTVRRRVNWSKTFDNYRRRKKFTSQTSKMNPDKDLVLKTHHPYYHVLGFNTKHDNVTADAKT